MFQLFLRARARNHFNARSDARDAGTDQMRLKPIAQAVETAIATAEAELIGLDQRITVVLARAAVTFGNGTDEYLERDATDSKYQDAFDIEIKNGQRRRAELKNQIENLRFLNSAMTSRFPDLISNVTGPSD